MEPELHTSPASLAGRLDRGAFGLFRRNPAFARVYAAQLVSYMGDWFASVALLSLVLAKTGSATLAGLVIAAQTLPFALVSPFAGVIVDRFDRKTVMVTADVLRALLALGLLLAQTPETIWIAFVCEVLLSGISAFFEPASSAALPNLVAKDDLARANIFMGAAWGTMLVVGAALGGLVAATLGNSAAFIGDAASFAISALLLIGVKARFHEVAPKRDASVTIVDDVRETVRFARKERRVLALLVVKAGFGLSAGVIGLISVFAYKVFGGGPATIGLLMSARGAGALAGPFLFRRWARDRDDRLFLGLTIAGVVFGIGYLIFAVSPASWLAAVGAFVAHVGGGSTWTLSTYGLQRFTPDAIRGRVFSFDYGLVTLTIAASVFFAGFAAARVDPRVVAAGIAVVALAWSVAWTVWRRRLFRAPTEPS
ncbi:MAG: MFS transporter [Chloroflexi bacterium]|nr:MFS transporter [Chloroflexota bacterium]